MAAVQGGTEIRVLGGFSIRRSGEEVPPAAFRGRLVRTLIRILLTRLGKFVPHDLLVEALWPGRKPADPIANLKVLVARARAGLGDPALVVTGPGGYSFAAGDACRVDAETFLAAVADGRRRLHEADSEKALALISAALDGWSGEPLPEDIHEDWAVPYRAMLGRAHLQALEDGARAALAVGRPDEAVGLAQSATAREPLAEAAHMLLAEGQVASGCRRCAADDRRAAPPPARRDRTGAVGGGPRPRTGDPAWQRHAPAGATDADSFSLPGLPGPDLRRSGP